MANSPSGSKYSGIQDEKLQRTVKIYMRNQGKSKEVLVPITAASSEMGSIAPDDQDGVPLDLKLPGLKTPPKVIEVGLDQIETKATSKTDLGVYNPSSRMHGRFQY